MRSYSSFVTEKINKKFPPKNAKSMDALKRGIQTQAEIDAAADAAKDIKQSGKLGNVTSDVKKELSKTLKQTPGDPKGSTMIKGTPDEKIIRDTKPTGDEGKFRRPAKRYRGKTFADVKAEIDTKEAPKIKKSIVPPKDGGKKGVENILKDVDKKYTPPSKTQSQNIQTNSVKNTAKKIADQGKKNKVINLNAPKGAGAPLTNKGAGTGSKANLDLPKFTQTDNPSFKTSKVTTGNTINYVEKPRVEIKNPPGMVDRRSYKGPAKNNVNLPKVEVKPKKNIITKSLEGAGVKNPITKVDKRTIAGKQLLKKQTLRNVAKGVGRVAAGAFAVKDYLDTSAKEKALGRSKTSARVAGLSKALGGYIGGGAGAALGSVAGLPGSIAGGAAGYVAGAKAGEKLYNVGRQLATGKKTFKQLGKDIGKATSKYNTTKPSAQR